MSVPRIWLKIVPPEVEAALTPLLDRWDYLLPSWCQELVIDWVAMDGVRGGPEGASLEAEPHQEYRFMRLIVFGYWLSEQPDVRERQAVHELCHALVEPLSEFALDMVDLARGRADKKYLEKQHIRMTEQVTCDVTAALMRRTMHG